MKRIKTLVLTALVSLLLLLIGCKEDSPTEPENSGKVIGEATIGSQGGKVETESLELTIPQFAFSNQNKLTVSLLSGQSPTGVNAVSDLFVIDGLPVNFNSPLELRIKIDGTTSGENFIAMGEDLFIRQAGSNKISYNLLHATVSDGFVVSEIPAPDPDNLLNKLSGANQITNTKQIRVQAWTSGRRLAGSGYNFVINVAVPGVSAAATQNLLESLEDAHHYYRNVWKFSYSARSKWPVTVNVLPLEAGVFGYYADSYWGINYGYLEFDSQKIEDLDEAKITAGHEFFHLVQSLYDPRSSYSKASGSNYTHYWLDEATGVWVEKYSASLVPYSSEIVHPYQMQPFEGMQSGTSIGAREHGYGMSILFEYLIHSGNLLDIYEQIKSSAHPVAAVINSTDSPFNWYPDFVRSYFLFEFPVFNVGPAFWLTNAHGTFSINSAADSVKNFSFSYPDISARYYKIDLNYSGMDENSSLSLNLTGDGIGDIILIKVTGSNFEFLETDPGSITIPNIKNSFVATGSDIYAIVTNSLAVSPYTNSYNMNLEVKLSESTNNQLRSAFIEFSGIRGTLRRTTSSGTSEYDYYLPGMGSTTKELQQSGNSYLASWDYIQNNKNYIGSFSFSLNNDATIITSLTVINEVYDASNDDYLKTNFTASNLPRVGENEIGIAFAVYGDSIMGYIDDIGYYREYTFDGEVIETLVPGTAYFTSSSRLSVNILY
ncbi:MAG: hypothetical protein J5I57_07170 [Melioribacteraceae bacterium]|nr:hypothetical protein [Melioribacteraceae bacterium]